MRAADPFVGRTELELGDLRRTLDGVERWRTGSARRRRCEEVAEPLRWSCRNSVQLMDHDRADARQAAFPAPSPIRPRSLRLN